MNQKGGKKREKGKKKGKNSKIIPFKKCILYTLPMVMQNRQNQRVGYGEERADLGPTGNPDLNNQQFYYSIFIIKKGFQITVFIAKAQILGAKSALPSEGYRAYIF